MISKIIQHLFLILCFLIVCAMPVMGEDSFLAEDEVEAIDEALAFLKMDRTDMSFNKDYVNRPDKIIDHWRLKIVDRILHDPLILPIYSRLLTDDLKKSRDNHPSVIKVAARELEVQLPAIALEEEVPDLLDTLEITRKLVGVTLKSRDKKRIKKLDPKLQSALSWILTGMNEIYPYVEKSYPSMSKKEWSKFLEVCREHFTRNQDDTKSEEQEKWEAFQLLKFSDRVGYKDLFLAGYAFSFYLQKAKTILLDFSSNGVHETDVEYNDIILELDTGYGFLVVGGAGSSIYDLGSAVIIDMGGADVYTYHSVPETEFKHIGIIMDFSGDDVYNGRGIDFGLGGCFTGISHLEDLDGNDHYLGGSFSLGASLYGMGTLIDHKGDDVYESDTCTQGAGVFGIGTLHDKQGDDSYRAAMYAQGFAYTRGFGVLDDQEGNDLYYAGGKYLDNPTRFPENYLSLSQGFSIGIRPYASGGIGVLIDSTGNDYYMTEVYGQGSSYWFSLGILLDEKGHDNYTSLQYSQGTGIHLSTGLLADLDGNDKYTLTHLGQGSNHDLSVAFLIDKKGDDMYSGRSAVQGGALTNSVTIFLDKSGNDCYYARDFGSSQGSGIKRRDFGNIGIFLDMGGKDMYSNEIQPGTGTLKHPMYDDTYRISGFYGVAIDKNSTPPSATGKEE
jgi:hypothetical protein